MFARMVWMECLEVGVLLAGASARIWLGSSHPFISIIEKYPGASSWQKLLLTRIAPVHSTWCGLRGRPLGEGVVPV